MRRGTTFVTGGKGLFEASGEVRYRINDSFGAVGFVDSGFVTANSDLSRRRATCAPASGSACATIPASASCGRTSPRRSTRAPTIRCVALYIGIGQAF